MRMMLAAERAELFQFYPFCSGAFIFRFAVVPVFAFAALELNNFSRHNFPFAPNNLRNNLRHSARAYGPATLANREA
jgi:hypothetical protein